MFAHRWAGSAYRDCGDYGTADPSVGRNHNCSGSSVIVGFRKCSLAVSAETLLSMERSTLDAAYWWLHLQSSEIVSIQPSKIEEQTDGIMTDF